MFLDQIDLDLKSAMKEKNEVTLSALRNLKAALKNAEIEKKEVLTDEEALKVVQKKVKQHKDSIDGFKAGGRQDLVATEQSQMQVLEKYLPKAMEESEVRAHVKAAISETSATVNDFGKVMKAVMVKVAGRADGSVISKIVKEELAK